MNRYVYRPVRYYLLVFACTWTFWIGAAVVGRQNPASPLVFLFLLFGLLAPSVTSLITVLTSKSPALQKDYKEKLTGFYRIKPLIVLLAIGMMGVVILASILLSLCFGESTDQFAFVGGFSFSIGGIPTLLTLILAAVFEEFGWRGYAEDSIASYHSWFKESIIFGIVWGLWHLPLFFVPGTYQSEILQMNPLYMLNFFLSVPPMGFFFTWVYVKNRRSILACIIFHFFVNFLQEQIAMTQITKCVETGVVFVLAIVIVLTNKDMFFETRHVGNLLEEK